MLRLQSLADTQQRSNERMLREAKLLLKRLQHEVVINQEQPRDVAVLQQAEQQTTAAICTMVGVAVI